MTLRELKEYKVSPPFTVSEIFNENFYINVNLGFNLEKVYDVIFCSSDIYSIFDIENNSFEFERMDSEKLDTMRIYLSNEDEGRQYIVLTLLYDSNNDAVRYIMEDKERRIYILCYAQKLFSIILKRYGIQTLWGVFHENEENGDGKEENHAHFIFTYDKEDVKFSDFARDFKDLIVNEEKEENNEEENMGE